MFYSIMTGLAIENVNNRIIAEVCNNKDNGQMKGN